MDSVEHVKKLREEYEQALDAAESRRAAYRGAILDLYRSGTPLREIAKELGLSHQRVHQIVSGQPARQRKLTRAAVGIGGALVIAAALGALRLAQAPPFASGIGSSARIVATVQPLATPTSTDCTTLLAQNGFSDIRSFARHACAEPLARTKWFHLSVANQGEQQTWVHCDVTAYGTGERRLWIAVVPLASNRGSQTWADLGPGESSEVTWFTPMFVAHPRPVTRYEPSCHTTTASPSKHSAAPVGT